MKRYPLAEDWHGIDKASNKVVMTYLLENCGYSGEKLGTVKHLSMGHEIQHDFFTF